MDTVKNITLDVKELIHSLGKKKAKLHKTVIGGQLKAHGSDTQSKMRVCGKGRDTEKEVSMDFM